VNAFVGCIVGFFVGKSDLPDKRELCVLNSLDSICRVCRVSTTEERPIEFGSRPGPRDRT
jgi:hypothetical protein